MEPAGQSLADALFTATQQRLLGLLFGQLERSFFVTELIELADVGRGTVQRELARLARSELVVIERHGSQKHYRANPDSPIYNELCSIVSKTVGIEENLRVALQPLAARISLTLIYGSVAKHADTASSDIDLLVVSDELTLEDLYATLSTVEQQFGRQVNPTLYTDSEFRKRRSGNNAFLSRVLAGPTVIFWGGSWMPNDLLQALVKLASLRLTCARRAQQPAKPQATIDCGTACKGLHIRLSQPGRRPSTFG